MASMPMVTSTTLRAAATKRNMGGEEEDGEDAIDDQGHRQGRRTQYIRQKMQQMTVMPM
jgi:hypothetical protein